MSYSLEKRDGRDPTGKGSVRVGGGPATQMADSYYPWEITRDSALLREDSGVGGSYGRLAELGHPVARFTEEVNVRMPTAAERRTLELDGTPVFDILHIAWTAAGRPIEAAFHVMPGHLWTLRYDWAHGTVEQPRSGS